MILLQLAVSKVGLFAHSLYGCPMKRIAYAGQAYSTGTGVAEALTQYATVVSRIGTSVAVDIPVQEDNGTVGIRTFLLNSTTQFVLDDIDGVSSEEDELARFPIPEFPAIGGKAEPAIGEKLDSFPVIDDYDLEPLDPEAK